MFPQMRRAAGIAAARRVVGGVSAADQHHRLFQAALFSASSNNSSARSHWFSYNGVAGEKASRAATHAFVGTMLFSTAATAVVEEVHAKESVNFRPKEVVLYQYEACPFCNKVKGISFRYCFLQSWIVHSWCWNCFLDPFTEGGMCFGRLVCEPCL